MRKGLIGSLAALLVGAGFSLAADPAAPSATPDVAPLPLGAPDANPPAPPAIPAAPLATPDADPAAPAAVDAPLPSDCCPFSNGCEAPCQGERSWVTGEYLLWWLKDAPLSTPIATVGSPADPVPGAIGQRNTRVINPDALDEGAFSGGRLTLGTWLGDDQTFGAEVSGFLLPSQSSKGFTASGSGANGTLAYVPFFDTRIPAENAYPFGIQGATSGRIQAVDRARLWGLEANGLLNPTGASGAGLTLLGGFRYLDLSEKLGIEEQATGGTTITSLDGFNTRNQFWGGQLGVRGERQFGDFLVSLDAKVALGDMHESVGANGLTTLVGTGVNTTVAGGFFAQPSNFGRRTHDVFAVVPEVGAQVGYDVTQHFRIVAGYEFLYASSVLRPGDQLDHRINFTQQAAILTGAGTLAGQAAPAPQSNHTDFWAQGVNLGLQFRW